MAPGLDKLQHIVVLMMENRSFDHMLGSLKAVNPKIDGVRCRRSLHAIRMRTRIQ